jgi:hypothetical protein
MCAEVANMVGDVSALRQAAFATATEYSETSQSTVGSLVDYSIAKSKYDSSYAYNKTEPLRKALLSTVSKINTPYIMSKFCIVMFVIVACLFVSLSFSLSLSLSLSLS